MDAVLIDTKFAQDIEKGLQAKPKYLQSKYFYDDEGSRIFQDIMRMPEYYLTDCELEIFQKQKQSIYQSFTKSGAQFNLIELGAGDGLKTKVLLSYFLNQNCDFEYVPIDISGDAVRNLVRSLETEFSELKTDGQIGDYFHLLEEMNHFGDAKKVILFLGSNIGNFQEAEALLFFDKLRNVMQGEDQLFIGFDLKKEEQIILDAYNDPHGHTANFNLNLLQRIDNELGADFDLSAFRHQEIYNPQTGTAKSELISLSNQKVDIAALGQEITFEKDESIFMEISQKYDLDMIEQLAHKSGFEMVENFYDSRNYFVNSLWRIK